MQLAATYDRRGKRLLLMTVLNLFPSPSEKRFHPGWSLLRDLCFRQYLVGSNRDRQILQLVSTSIIEKAIKWGEAERYVDAEDSHTIAQAYSALLYVSQRDTSSARILPADFMCYLTTFAMQELGPDRLVSSHDLGNIMYTSFQFQWMLFDHRGQISVEDQANIQQYALYVFLFFTATQEDFATDDEKQYIFARILGDVEIMSLIARVLLIVTYDGVEVQDNDRWEAVRGGMFQMAATVKRAVRLTPERFIGAKEEWAKVHDHLEWLLELRRSSGDSTPTAIECVYKAYRRWNGFGVALDDEDGLPRGCAYPRCFRAISNRTLLGARHFCGKCRAVAYCDQKCQHA
ncbi:hypothetical protein FRC08_003080 [Ceratobasidium sp. 394]|nr:hypothetical protein FRC08_003080 [Ceratobasidium sp. 394]